MATQNAINLNGNGIPGYNNTTGVFTATALTQYSVLTGGANAQSINQVAPSATSGVPFISQGSSAQGVFGTAVVAGGGLGVTTLTAYAPIFGGTTSTGAVQSGTVGTSGQVLTSNGAGALPTFQSAPTGVSWVDVTSGTQTIAVSTGYVTDNATLVTYTLPATAAFGSVVRINGGTLGLAGWTIAQNALQGIVYGNKSTTVGITGSLSSTQQFDCVTLLAIVGGTSTIWQVMDSVGNPLFV